MSDDPRSTDRLSRGHHADPARIHPAPIDQARAGAVDAEAFDHRAPPDLRLVTPAVALWISAALGVGATDPGALFVPTVSGFVLAAILLAVFAWSRRGAALVVAALLVCGASVGLAAVAADAPERRPGVLQEAARAHRHLDLRAITTQTLLPPDEPTSDAPTGLDARRDPRPPATDSGSYEVRITAVTIRGTVTPVSVPARVFGDPLAGGAPIGAALHLTGTVAPTDPGDSTSFLVYATGDATLVGPPSPMFAWADVLRSSFRAAAERLPGDGGALLPGLAIGDTSSLDDDLDTAMKASALTHLTAVSGANCAIVVGLVMLAGAHLGLSRSGRVLLSVIVLAAFVVLVTPEPSVLRAAVMALLVLVAVAGGRPARGIPVLCLAVIVLVTLDPWLSREYGFILSVLATGGLLLLAGPLTRALSRWLPAPVSAALAVPIAAQLACQPVLILLAPTIPTYGIIANMLAGPAAPAATVIGLVACLLLTVAPPLGITATWIAWLPSAWIAGVAHFFAGLPAGAVVWMEGAVGVLVLAGLTVVGLVAILGTTLPRVVRRLATASLVLFLITWSGTTVGATVGTARSRPNDWIYAMCDVGQGDASLIRSSGSVALIDTGPEEESLTHCLDALDVERIDLLVLTHFDLDHVGGARAVLGRVDHVLIGPTDGLEATALADDFRAGGAGVEQVAAGAHGSLGDLGWEVLWPLPPPRVVEPGNDASVVVLVDDDPRCTDSCGPDDPSALFLGDLGEEAQSLLAGAGRVRPVDVVKVAHHGSADQSLRLYETLAASVGLVGVGADNDYGHPAPALLDLLEVTGTAVFRTDRDGLILVAPGEDAVEVWRETTARP